MKQFFLRLLRSPYFMTGLVLRLLLLLLVVPAVQREWFVPFLTGTTAASLIDPWTGHILRGGDFLAFPYGLVMFFVYLPGAVIGALLAELFGHPQLVFFGFGLVTLFLDLILLALLVQLGGGDLKKTILFYWLSPLVLYICYWHGQLDLLPVVLLVFALSELKKYRPRSAAASVGLAIAAKLSMTLAAPVVMIYLWRNSRLRHLVRPFVTTLIAVGILALLPGLYSAGFRQMVLHSPEIGKVYAVAMDLGGGLKVYLFPVVYALVLYGAWRLERLSSELLLTLVGISFFLVLLLTPASTGWFLWVAPFLVLSQVRGDFMTRLIGLAFSILFAVSSFLFARGAAVPVFGLDLSTPSFFTEAATRLHIHSLFVSAICTLGLIICIRMFIHGIRRNDFFRLSRAPLAIGIAGDSGSGKDTLVRAFVGAFGSESVTCMSGDDYHKWNRRAPMWQALTHLDPRANDLYRFTKDVMTLLDGKAVVSRFYDHESGRFFRGTPRRGRQVLILSGLHVLYVPQIRRKLDVSIFLDMSQELRTYFKLKRDTEERGRSRESVEEAMQRRVPDSERFIAPQAPDADIIFSLRPADDTRVDESVARGDYKLQVHLKDGVHYEDIMKLLIGICGMRVDVTLGQGSGSVDVLVEGEVTSDDIRIAAQEIVGEVEELLAVEPDWQSGMLGVMQLISLARIVDVLRARLSFGSRYAYA